MDKKELEFILEEGEGLKRYSLVIDRC